jgi:hypothetical protein
MARCLVRWHDEVTDRPFPMKLKGRMMRSILLWLIGIPLPIILLLALCTHHF